MLDPVDGILGIELIDGPSVRSVLGGGADDEGEGEDGEEAIAAATQWDDYLGNHELNAGKAILFIRFLSLTPPL